MMETTSNSWLLRMMLKFISRFDRRKVLYCSIGEPGIAELPDGSRPPIPGPVPGPGPKYICYLTPEKSLPENPSLINLILIGMKDTIDQLERDHEIRLIFVKRVKVFEEKKEK